MPFTRPNASYRFHDTCEPRPRPGSRRASWRWPAYLVLVLAIAIATATVLASDGAAAQVPPGRIEVTSFAGDTVHALVWDRPGGQGRAVRLHPRDLVGFTWTVDACDAGRCETMVHRIAAVAPDTSRNTMPRHGDNDDVWLFRLDYASASAPDQWYAVCDANASGSDMGIFVDGRWSGDGDWLAGGWTFSCLDGVIAKCVRSWGYKPWKRLRSPVHGDVDLQPLHQACTRAARADYCGDGTSHTRENTLVDMFDVYGFNVREGAPGFQQESSFDQHGALSVSIPRYLTATPTEAGWRFATCERPRQAPAGAGAPLIHVWSDPLRDQRNPSL